MVADSFKMSLFHLFINIYFITFIKTQRNSIKHAMSFKENSFRNVTFFERFGFDYFAKKVKTYF